MRLIGGVKYSKQHNQQPSVLFQISENVYFLIICPNHNLVPRVSHLTGLGGKMRDPGNDVGLCRS